MKQPIESSGADPGGGPPSPESRIVQAAIDCIEKEGLEGATIRRIAERAGVNSAAINYYFRSKDNLVRRVLDVTLRNAFDWQDFRESDGAPPSERLAFILERLMKGALDYPGLSKAHFSGFTGGRSQSPAMEAFSRFLEELEADLAGRGAKLDRKNLQLAIVQAMAGVLLPAIFAPGLFQRYAGIDFHDPDTRRRYAGRLARAVLSCG